MSIQPVVSQEILELDWVPCRGGKHGDVAVMFEPGTGYVPDLVTLYEQVRGTPVAKAAPLSRRETLSQELCLSCGRDKRNKKFGIRMYPTQETLKLMATWESQNAAMREQEDVERLRQRNSANKGFVLETFTKYQHKERAPKKGRRLPAAKRRELAMMPRIKHEEPKKGKNKQKDDKKKRK
jgi:hypothetical protein